MEIVWTVAIIGWLICGIAGAALLSRYEKAGTGFILGFLLGPIGWIIAWTMRDSQKHKELLEATDGSPLGSGKRGRRKERKCPFCAELILAEANICKHCRSRVEPEEERKDYSGDKSYNIKSNSIASLEDLGVMFTRDGEGNVIRVKSSSHSSFGFGLHDAQLTLLRGFRDLRSVDLSHCSGISHLGLEHIKGLTKIQNLNLFNCRAITDEALVHIKEMASLKELNISRCQISESNLVKQIKGMTNLRVLDASDCPNITNKGLITLKKLLPNCEIRGINHFSKIMTWGILGICAYGLVNLVSTYVTSPSDSITTRIIESVETLKQVGAEIDTDTQGKVCGVTFGIGDFVKDSTLIHLKDMPELRHLDLKMSAITDSGMVHIGSLLKLQELDISNTNISDKGLMDLDNLPHLQQLNLAMTQITDLGLEQLKRKSNLQKLILNGCDKITANKIQELREALPKCTIEKLY